MVKRKADGEESQMDIRGWHIPAIGEMYSWLMQDEAPERCNPSFTHAGRGSTLHFATEDQYKS